MTLSKLLIFQANLNAGKYARTLIENARKKVAKCINAPQSDIIFTSGGSESNNWVISTAVKHFQKKAVEQCISRKPHIITSTVEHDSITVPLTKLKEEGVIGKVILEHYGR